MADQEEKAPRLLALLEGAYLPTARGRRAYKRPPQPPDEVLRSVRTPAWNWTYHGPDVAEKLAQGLADGVVNLDANAAYVTSASSVSIARDQLERTGPLDAYHRWPGFYQVELGPQDPWQEWGDTRLMSPLGQGVWRPVVWLSEPTVTLLTDLAQKDRWPSVTIMDSWTSPEKARLTAWTDQLRAMRTELITLGDTAGYARFKIAYSQAVQMVKGHKLCEIQRPDWYHAIHAQHTANLWRKAWNCVKAGHGPLSSGRVDALTFTRSDLDALQNLTPPPLRIDQSGLAFGTFKEVRQG